MNKAGVIAGWVACCLWPAVAPARPAAERVPPTPVKLNVKKLDLVPTPHSGALDGIQYPLDVQVCVSKDKVKVRTHSDGGWREYGEVLTVPRIRLTAHKDAIPGGATAVVAYYSKLAGKLEPNLEYVEHLRLPAVAAQQTAAAQGRGIALYRSERVDKRGFSKVEGRAFYALVVSIYAPDGTLLIQRGTTVHLAREAPRAMQPPKAFLPEAIPDDVSTNAP